MKIDLSLAQVKQLHEAAVTNGTLKPWALLAIEWMEGAEKEIARLRREAAAEVKAGTGM
jgi:hypothetical protein